MATERCEAYVPTDNKEREARYVRYYGRDMPLITKMMLSLQDDPRKTQEFYKSHLAKATENAAFNKVKQLLPVTEPTRTQFGPHTPRHGAGEAG